LFSNALIGYINIIDNILNMAAIEHINIDNILNMAAIEHINAVNSNACML